MIPFGLHHVLNNIAFFQVGSFVDAGGAVVTGDLMKFFAGDPEGGMFTAGGYAVMMFGLPAVCYARVRAAKKHNRKAVGGLLLGAALTGILTGITEPIEFVCMEVSGLAGLTRIRLSVKNDKMVDERHIRRLGVTQIVKLGC